MTRDHCSSCERQFFLERLDSQYAIERHNIECAETGERSYAGHKPCRGVRRIEEEILRRVSERLRAVDPKAANALARLG